MMSGPGTGMQQYPPRTGGFEPATYGGSGGYPPQRKSWARRWLPWLIPAVVIIAVVAVVVSLMNSGGKTYFVPTVNGMPLAQAEAQIRQAGLTYTVRRRAAPRSRKGYVIDTNPANGAAASPTTPVTIYVSAGEAKVTVPERDRPAGQRRHGPAARTSGWWSIRSRTRTRPRPRERSTSRIRPPIQRGGTRLDGHHLRLRRPDQRPVGDRQEPARCHEHPAKRRLHRERAAAAGAGKAPGRYRRASSGTRRSRPNTQEPRGTTITIFYQPQATATPTPTTTTPTSTPTSTPTTTPPTNTTTPTPTGTGTVTRHRLGQHDGAFPAPLSPATGRRAPRPPSAGRAPCYSEFSEKVSLTQGKTQNHKMVRHHQRQR